MEHPTKPINDFICRHLVHQINYSWIHKQVQDFSKILLDFHYLNLILISPNIGPKSFLNSTDDPFHNGTINMSEKIIAASNSNLFKWLEVISGY